MEAESGIREKNESREQMTALLAAVREGDLVLCDKLDRWSRDTEFTLRSVREIREKGATFFSIGDNCDPDSREGSLMLTIRAALAKEEHARIKERMVGTRRLLRDRGLYVEGLPPWGYRRQDAKGETRNTLVIDADEAAEVRRVFKLCIAGKAIDEIATLLDVKRDRVSDALHRRLYVGDIEDSKGQWIPGKHEAIIDARTYQEAQDALLARTNGSRSPTEGVETSTWWLRDVATCLRCGAKMSAAYAGPKGEGRRHYFACFKRCTSRYMRVRDAEQACDPLVTQRLIELKEELGAPAPARVVKMAPRLALKERRAKLDARRARVLEMYAEGLTSKDELHLAIAKLEVERLKIDALAIERPAPTTEERREVLKSVVTLGKAWSKMPAESRREAMRILATSVGLAAGKAPKPVWRTVEELTAAR